MYVCLLPRIPSGMTENGCVLLLPAFLPARLIGSNLKKIAIILQLTFNEKRIKYAFQ